MGTESTNIANKIVDIIKGIQNIVSDISNMGNEYDRIVFIGAHGTGKTTLANKLSELLNIPVVESVAREFFRNWSIMESSGLINDTPNTRKSEVMQNILCSQSHWDFMRWVNVGYPIIMTRCPLDTIAYGFADDYVRDSVMSDNLNILKNDPEFRKAIEKSLFVYIPIEFDIENDGVRPTDKKYQKEVDGYMRTLMSCFDIAPLVVTGSVEERCRQVLVKLFGDETADDIMNDIMND